MCQFTDIKNITITRLLVCARLIDQFTKIYDLPVGSICRELWWNICHNLQGFYRPLAVLQMEDLRPRCTNIPRELLEFCWSLKGICLIEIVSIYRYTVPLWFNLERFIIRRLGQCTENYGAPFVTNSQIFGNAMRSRMSHPPGFS